ncbi:TRAP transporter substrate-binding protein [Halomonas sp. GT]|uniref:TRAP transporter substrate-binding protein n=1 Tax=Halomonas sp. GT TaxID=1971364 RepID=UPI0009F664F9|nr:TRAP transporter substrate-binding protein DctP [Halomonas sp. GT]
MINNFKKSVLAASIVAFSTTVIAQESLRLGHYFPAEDFRGKTAQYFADAVDQELFDIQVYPSESLVRGRDGFMATARGSVDIYSLFGGYAVGSVDLMRIFTIPFPPDEFTDSKLLEFANDERTLDILDEEFERSNVKLLGFINSSGQTTVFLADSIDSLEDLRGKRIRGVGGYTDPALQDLGSSVVFMSAAEQFLQLQTGGVDGVITTDSSYANLGLSEVAPVMMDGSIVRTPYPLIMNKRKWDRLSSDQQEALMTAAAETVAWSIENFEEESERLGEKVRSEASEVYALSDEDLDQASQIRNKYLQQFSDEYGDEGERLVELFNEYL